MKQLKRYIYFFLFLSFNVSSAEALQSTRLVDYTYLGELPKNVAESVLKKIPPLDTLHAEYSLKLYKITYHTTAPNGEETIASGLVSMPISPEKSVGVVSYYHGTRVMRDDVPSRNNQKYAMYSAVFGSAGGYMLVMADYLGLGDSTLPIHPYVNAETLANSNVDMLIAAKELAHTLNYPINKKLFLAGYSEGGYTTVVTYEALLKSHPELPVTAVSPGSAPYDWDETMKFIILDHGPRSTVYITYFFYAMQIYQHYWTGLDEIFNKPYDTLVPDLFDGTHDLPEILTKLPENPIYMLDSDFLGSLLNGTNPYSELMKISFNHYDFTPTSPFLMIGTKGDHDVPYHGAEIAYDVFKKKSDLVQIQSVSDTMDHIQAFPVITKEQLLFFKKYDADQS